MNKVKLFSLSLILIFGLMLVLVPNAPADTMTTDFAGFDPMATSQAIVGGQIIDLPVQAILGPDGKLAYIIDNFNLSTADFAISVSGALEPDPTITYGVVAQNFTNNDLAFNFVFSTPIVVPPGPTSVSSSLSYSLTDATNNGVRITPNTARGNVQDNNVSNPPAIPVPMGVDLDNTGIAIGPDPLTPAGTPVSYIGAGAFNLGPQGGPVGPWNTLTITTSFKLSGNFDVATVNGSATINPAGTPPPAVPEPCSIFLLCSGLLGLVGLKRRKIV